MCGISELLLDVFYGSASPETGRFNLLGKPRFLLTQLSFTASKQARVRVREEAHPGAFGSFSSGSRS
jgi:hypothetical protein